ncbi:MAG: fumarylacetoacetate hydrolase family protein [Pseudomonadota bacterium]
MFEYKIGSGLVSGQKVPVLLIDDKVYELSSILRSDDYTSLEDVFSNWIEVDQALSSASHPDEEKALSIEKVEILTPLENPRKVVCIGTNYHDHLREMKVAKLPEFPYAFLRPQTCLAAHKEKIHLPSTPKMIDWEAELGIIIGSSFGPKYEGNPTSAIAGYTVLNDLSARDWIHDRPFVGIDWVMQKSWDQFQPTGPWITPTRFVADPENLDIELRLNGAVKQKSNTNELIFGVREIMTHLCGMMTLEPGDIIATGTPAGVGFGRQPQEFIQSGDHIVVTIEGLGTLENTFV